MPPEKIGMRLMNTPARFDPVAGHPGSEVRGREAWPQRISHGPDDPGGLDRSGRSSARSDEEGRQEDEAGHDQHPKKAQIRKPIGPKADQDLKPRHDHRRHHSTD